MRKPAKRGKKECARNREYTTPCKRTDETSNEKRRQSNKGDSGE